MIRPAYPHDVASLSRIHAQGFLRGWSEEEITALLAEEGTLALLDAKNQEIVGFIILRVVFDECEILTIATDASHQRQGIGEALLEHAFAAVRERNVLTLFLEVAEDNIAALQLYAKCGFTESGRRREYYPRLGRLRADAILMHKTL